MVAAAVTAPFATEVAVSVTVPAEVAFAGEVYVTAAPEALDAGETVPQVAPLQVAPESVQMTPLFWVSFCTVAVKVCVTPPVARLAVVGDTVTTIAGGAVTVMRAAADFVPSVTEVALRVIVAGLGSVAGAV
jgi:hypothetical protein